MFYIGDCLNYKTSYTIKGFYLRDTEVLIRHDNNLDIFILNYRNKANLESFWYNEKL